MGHYCYKCEDKIYGGKIPTTCNCIECFCERCWESLFKDIIPVSETLYKKQDDHYIIVEDPLLKVVYTQADCPNCGVEFNVTKCMGYN